jgi:hypothetical protein
VNHLIVRYLASGVHADACDYKHGSRLGLMQPNDDVIQELNALGTLGELAFKAYSSSRTLLATAHDHVGKSAASYAELLAGKRLLPPVSHAEPSRCWVTGTGLTHLDSSLARDKMASGNEGRESDSLKMFRAGLTGGKPPAGEIGVQPEWYFKGNGATLVTSGDELPIPEYALDAGEEPELAGVYWNDARAIPRRIGFVLANDFSDHVLEAKSYLYVAASKLRACAISPALLLGDCSSSIVGTTRVLRDGQALWERAFRTGEQHMCHSIANLEHHHFKHRIFRRAHDIHVHLFGTAVFSHADGVTKQSGDVFQISAPGFGPALENRLATETTEKWQVEPL